jgi:hypothetical protein
MRCRSAAFPKLFNAGFSCYNVTPLPENCCSTLFTTEYKRLTEGACEAFWPFGFWLSGFWMWEAFGREDCWRKIAEEGKMNG